MTPTDIKESLEAAAAAPLEITKDASEIALQ